MEPLHLTQVFLVSLLCVSLPEVNWLLNYQFSFPVFEFLLLLKGCL